MDRPCGRFFSCLGRYNRNRVTPASSLHRYFQLTRVSTRLHQTVLGGQSQRARCLGLLAAALALPRLRNSRVPHAGQAKRQDHAPQSGLSSEKQLDARAASGHSFQVPALLPRTPGSCRGPIKATRSGTVTQRDASGSIGSHFFSCALGVRPWLPQFGRPAPRHARLAPLRIAHDFLLGTGGKHRSARPSRRYRSTTAG